MKKSPRERLTRRQLAMVNCAVLQVIRYGKYTKTGISFDEREFLRDDDVVKEAILLRDGFNLLAGSAKGHQEEISLVESECRINQNEPNMMAKAKIKELTEAIEAEVRSHKETKTSLAAIQKKSKKWFSKLFK